VGGIEDHIQLGLQSMQGRRLLVHPSARPGSEQQLRQALKQVARTPIAPWFKSPTTEATFGPETGQHRPMASISSHHLVDAVLHVERMNLHDRQRLAEEVHAGQPNLFFSVLVLQRYGATLEQIEVVLNLLLVFHVAMKNSGASWPVVSEDVQERCLTRITGRVRFIDGLSPQLQAQAASNAAGDHPEQQLLAYVYGKFMEHGLLGIKTEAEKMLLLSALTLVECIAQTAPRTGK
jgi:hypothetical protein